MHKNMHEILAEAEQEALEMQRYLDRMTGLLHAAARTRDLKTMRITSEILKEERREMNRHSDLLNQKLDLLKEGKMKRVTLFAGVVLLLLLLAAGFTMAQDAPLATNTAQVIEGAATLVSSEPVATEAPAATEQPPVIVVNNPAPAEPSDRKFYVIGFIGLLLLFGVRDAINSRQIGALLSTINRALDNKQVIDEARQRYSESSLSTQEFVKLLRGILGFVGSMDIPGIDPTIDNAGEFLGDVTSPEAPKPETPAIPNPDPFKPQYPIDSPGSFG